MALLECINLGGTTVIACTHDKNLVDRMAKEYRVFYWKLIRDACNATYSDKRQCSGVSEKRDR